MKKKLLWVISALFFLLAAAFAAYLIWCDSLEDQVIWEDVSVNGVALKGLTPSQAEQALRQHFIQTYQDSAVTISIAEETFSVNIFPLLDFHADELIRQAYETGHGDWYLRGLEYYRLHKYGSKKDLTADPFLADPELLPKLLEETGIYKVNTLKESIVTVGETSLTIEKGHTGVTADRKALEKEVLDALQKGDYNASISCPVTARPPKDIDLFPYYFQVFQTAKSAAFDPITKKVSRSRQGVSFPVKKAMETFQRAPEDSLVEIDFHIAEPKISTEEFEALLFRDVLSEYTTYGGGAGRFTNITLAVEACNGKILMPGEVFSYNETLGERTAERGYQSATVYENGQAVEGIGGGICQVSSTLFAAILHTDLEIVERYNHSLTVGYLPLGMDATVSWGGPDFRFRNTTNYPLRIDMTYQDGAIQVHLTGTQERKGSVDVSTENLEPLVLKTYRHYYDGQGNLLETRQVAYSVYKGIH